MTKSKEVQVTANSKKETLLADLPEDIESQKTQKRHRRHLVNPGLPEVLQIDRENKPIKLPETSEFSLGIEEKPKEASTRKVSHTRVESNKSGNLSVSRPSSSTKKISKPAPPSANLTLKRAIQKVKISFNPNSSTLRSSTSFASIKVNRPSMIKTPTVVADTSTLRSKIEANLDKQKTKTLDKITKKIATLIKESGNMKVTKLAKRENQSSASRDSIASASQKKFTGSFLKAAPTPTGVRKSQASTELLSLKSKINPVLEEYKVTKVHKKDKLGFAMTDQLGRDQKLTTSNYSCSSQLSSGREYLHRAGVKNLRDSRENPYLNKTNRSSTSNSRISSRGASISGVTKPPAPATSEKPASLKNLLKQIHSESKEVWSKPEPVVPKKAQLKPIALPDAPFVRLKAKPSTPLNLFSSTRLK